MMTKKPPIYHDLHITTSGIKRMSILDLPYNIIVQCTRVGGWEVWDMHGSTDFSKWTLLGGEYDGEKKPLRLDIKGKVIVSSFEASK
jgi:hypothetical protein